MTSKEFFVKSYGYIWIKFLKYDGLYWFKAGDGFYVAVEFLPPQYDPLSSYVVSVENLEFIKDNIVGAVIDGQVYVFNVVYTKHIEDFKC